MTTAEKIYAKGEARGEIKGPAEMLLKQLACKFGPLPENIKGIVHAAPAEKIQAWGLRLVSAKRLKDVLSEELPATPRRRWWRGSR